MASLQYSPPNSVLPTHHSQPLSSAKQSHFLLPRGGGRTTRRHFGVSCTKEKQEAQERLDRRNMLLGLGGLYGAANLVSNPQTANADPILSPDFTKCGTAYIDPNNPVKDSCCPPLSDTIIDYKLPTFTELRVREPAHALNEKRKAQYALAMQRMRDLDTIDPNDPRGFKQQANIHCAYCNGAHDQPDHPGVDIQVHNCWLFYPFHRWYLYFYERILGELVGDPTFALPFWNWDHPKGMRMPSVFDKERSALYNNNRNQALRPPAIVNLGWTPSTDDAQTISNNLTIVRNEMIGSVSDTLSFMGKIYRDGDPPNSQGGGTVENGSHTVIHWTVGDPRNDPFREDMGNFYSAGRDPIFYCHHANVDRMWSVWKTLDTPGPKDIKDKDFLEASFLFYDEKKRLVRVKVGDSLDNEKMGYTYKKVDLPWKGYRPTKKAARVKIEKIASNADKPDGLFPLTLNKVVRVLVPKTAKGKADEVLVLENVESDTSKFVKFDVFINDEDDKPNELDRAEYAGSFAQVPHRNIKAKTSTSTISLKLTDLYEDIDIGDDDELVVTLIPRSNGQFITIGGIKVAPAPKSS